MKLGSARYLWLFFTFFTFSFSHAADTASDWRRSDPKNFNDVELLFLNNGCDFIWLVGYIYFPNTNTLSSGSATKAQYLAYESLFQSNDGCTTIVPIDELNAALQIDIQADDGPTFIFFAAPYDPKTGEDQAFSKKTKKLQFNRLTLAGTLTDLPKYLVRTPLTGFKPQKL